MTLLYVPIIDLEPYFEGSQEGKMQVAQAVDQACRDIGFLIIKKHRIPRELLDQVTALSQAFFALPLEEKRKVDRPRRDQVRGFSAVAEESLAYSTGEAAPGDLKESFSIGPSQVPDTPYFTGPAAGPHFAPNVWPAEPMALREHYEAYFVAMSELAMHLMRIFALALHLPEHYFDDKIDRHISMFRALSYPPLRERADEGQFRASPHSDYGSLTIVYPDAPGLQVRNKAGEWVDVPYDPDGFAVNIGDLMMQWTNDRWISTVHRVVVPGLEEPSNKRRQSLVFFHQPNYDAMVECLPSCLAPGESPRHAPISSGDHLSSKFVKQTTFGGTKEVA